jgi:hypothetical protein
MIGCFFSVFFSVFFKSDFASHKSLSLASFNG